MADMSKSSCSEDQIGGLLRQADAGKPAADICRKGCFNDETFYKWRWKLCSMEPSDTKWLR